MPTIHPKAFFGDKIIPIESANLSVASSAILYGLSVYTVFPIIVTPHGLAAFRLRDHYARLINSARIIGIDTFEPEWDFSRFKNTVAELAKANNLDGSVPMVFVRATVHVSDLIPGTRSRGLGTTLSIFIYDANPIIPQGGARLKTSVWRRVPDYAIPSRAKVNGAYVNSVLGRQDALDSGYDDCVFLDNDGHVCELSAANIFIVRNGKIITPGHAGDILEGINRMTILELAESMGIAAEERPIDLTELYVADEIFACGTSSFVAPIVQIDARKIGTGTIGPVTDKIKAVYSNLMSGDASDALFKEYFTPLI